MPDTSEGGALRTKLEEAIAENNRLQQENKALVAADLIREQGLTLVKPEDLAGVPREDMATQAAELQTQAETARADMIRTLYQSRGFEGDALQAAVDQVLAGEVPGGSSGSDDDGAAGRVRQYGQVGGEPPARVQDWEGLTGLELIKAGLKD